MNDAQTGTDKVETLADKLNAELAAGHTVVATVYAGGMRFAPKWAGAFSMSKDGFCVVFSNGKKKTRFFVSGTKWTVFPGRK